MKPGVEAVYTAADLLQVLVRMRLPLAFRLPGDRVRVRRVEGGILLEPVVTDIDAWFAELDRFAGIPFMEEGRRQPPMPEAEDVFG